MSSNVGNAQVYEAGDQRTKSNKEIEEEKKDARFHEGKDNAHKAGDKSWYTRTILSSRTDAMGRG